MASVYKNGPTVEPAKRGQRAMDSQGFGVVNSRILSRSISSSWSFHTYRSIIQLLVFLVLVNLCGCQKCLVDCISNDVPGNNYLPTSPALSAHGIGGAFAGTNFVQPGKLHGAAGALMSSTVSTPTSTANSEFSNDKNSNNNNRLTTSHPVIPGSVLHLFQRYGYLSLSMRVVPRNDTQSWVFLEPTKPVFDPSTYEVKEQMFLTPDNGLPLHNEFHIDLCEDIQQLIQAYFRRFTIEGFDKPWHAFAGGWRSPSLAKYMGIDSTYVKGDYKYMLVRVLMVRSTGKFVPFANITNMHSTDPAFRSLRTNDYTSSYNFFNDVGTHYVNSYLTGNAIYQVFVYDAQGFDAVKRRLRETGWARNSYMAQLPYLLPIWVKHMGKVMILNASPQTTQNIRESLTIRFLFSVYPNIFKMHDNANLVKRIEKYLKAETEGLIGLELKNIGFLFNNLTQREWYLESLKQTMSLWENNL